MALKKGLEESTDSKITTINDVVDTDKQRRNKRPE